MASVVVAAVLVQVAPGMLAEARVAEVVAAEVMV